MALRSWSAEAQLTIKRLFEKYVHDTDDNPNGIIHESWAADMFEQRHLNTPAHSLAELRDIYSQSVEDESTRRESRGARGRSREHEKDMLAEHIEKDGRIEATAAFSTAIKNSYQTCFRRPDIHRSRCARGSKRER